MRNLFLAASVFLLGGGVAEAACPFPNPNDTGPPFYDGCDLSASGLNNLTSKQGFSTGWPVFSGNLPSDIFRINVNSFPLASEQPATIAQGIVSAVNVPVSGYNQFPFPPTAISGYTMNTGNFSTLSSAVAVYGLASENQDIVGTPFGANFAVQNCAVVGCADGTGHEASSWEVLELDANIVKKSGNLTPGGSLIGLKIIGASSVVPSGNGAWAIEIAPVGVIASPMVPWNFGLKLDDAAASAALDIGAAGVAGPSVASQGVNFHSYNSGSTRLTGTMQLQSTGEFDIMAPSTGSVVFKAGNSSIVAASSGDIQTVGHFGSSGQASLPTVTTCGTGASVVTGSTDTAGSVVIGSTNPTTACTITFATAFSTITPVIVITGVGTGSSILSLSTTSTGSFTIAASADIHGQTVSWIALSHL